MSFELVPYKYPHTGGRKEFKVPSLTLSKNGTIRFNTVLAAKLEEWRVEAFLLLWDKTSLRIGFKPVAKTDPRAYRISGKRSRDMSASSFYKSTGIEMPQKAIMIPIDIARSVEMITIDLPRQLTVGEPYGNGFNVVRP